VTAGGGQIDVHGGEGRRRGWIVQEASGGGERSVDGEGSVRLWMVREGSHACGR
jgi:hypothetical protein